jgi:hypothetical protein
VSPYEGNTSEDPFNRTDYELGLTDIPDVSSASDGEDEDLDAGSDSNSAPRSASPPVSPRSASPAYGYDYSPDPNVYDYAGSDPDSDSNSAPLDGSWEEHRQWIADGCPPSDSD